jgi:putative ABC transport system substrate-binding protein
LEIQLVERHVLSIEQLQESVRSVKMGEMDAFFEVQDALVTIQDQLIIDAARAKKLPTMFFTQSSVVKGGLASYSVNRQEMGHLSAKYVQRILSGVQPKDLPVEGIDNMALVINLKTAKQIGLTIPPNVLAKADKVIK